MRIARFSIDGVMRYGPVTARGVIDAPKRLGAGFQTLGGVLRADRLGEILSLDENDADYALDHVQLEPMLPEPEKIICVGPNLMTASDDGAGGGRAQAARSNPSLHIRLASSLVGHGQAVLRPRESRQLDCDGVFALIIGKAGRRIARAEAMNHVAGVTLMNDATVRDWARHAKANVTQGKNFERSGAIGPWMVTRDAIADFAGLQLATKVSDRLRHAGAARDMLYPFAHLISYVSTFTTLRPGDVIASGSLAPPTPRGEAPTPHLDAGDIVEIASPQIGLLRNPVTDED